MEATTNIHLIFELSLYSLNTSLQDFVELGHLIETQASSPDRQHPAQKKRMDSMNTMIKYNLLLLLQ